MATRLGDLFAAPVTNTTNNATIAGTTNVACSAGETVYLSVGVRGSSLIGAVTSLSGLPGDAVTEIVSTHQGTSSAGNNIVRIYLPTGMASGTVITVTVDSAAIRKTLYGQRFSGLANANVHSTPGTASATSGTALTSGTSGATTATGIHLAQWVVQSTATLTGFTAGSDEEGALNEVADFEVGTSSFQRTGVYWRAVTAAHAGGMTGTATSGGTPAAWSGLNAIWADATAKSDPPAQARRRRRDALLVR